VRAERGAGISYLNFYDFLLLWPGRPITVDNKLDDI
jgi:hypothetical protein